MLRLSALLLALLLACHSAHAFCPNVQPRGRAGPRLTMHQAGGSDSGRAVVERRGAVLRSLGLSGVALALVAGVAPPRPAGANVGEGESSRRKHWTYRSVLESQEASRPDGGC